MRGLPASGKSTYAKQLVADNPNRYKRINRDDMRAMFDVKHTSKGNEKFIKRMRDILIVEALKDGKHVIVDDTNLSDKNEIRIRQIAQEFAKEHEQDIRVEIKEMEATLAECLERDSKREKQVGEKVIRRMHRQFYSGEGRYSEQDESLPKAIVCDLDGTLALLNGRNPFMAFKCEEDGLNQPVAHILEVYKKLGYAILLLSGRSDEYQEETLRWLTKHEIEYDLLRMRPMKDSRKDSIFKRELYDQNIAGKYQVEFILDDRNQVVNMWRDELKLPCFQVYYGDF